MNVRLVLAIIIAVTSVLAGASTQLDPIFGHTLATSISGGCNLLTTVLAAVMGVLSTQTSMVQNVKSMDGVSRVWLNEKTSPSLAAAAVQPGDPKIAPEPGQERAVQKVAEQA